MSDIGTTIQSILNGDSGSQSGNELPNLAQSTSPQAGSLPQDAQAAEGDLGDQSYNNYCQQFVEQVAYGKTNMFPSAADAWSNYAQSGQATPGTNGIQPGDIIYFSPDKSNGYFGHTGIFTGNNNFVSATYNGVQNNNLDKWERSTGQQVLGYVKNPENLPQIGGQNGSN